MLVDVEVDVEVDGDSEGCMDTSTSSRASNIFNQVKKV